MFFKRYLDDSDGGVSVDWVVITAAIVGLGVIVTTIYRDTVEARQDRLNQLLDLVQIHATFPE